MADLALDQTARIAQHVEALERTASAHADLTNHLLIELAIAAIGSPLWSDLTGEQVDDKAIAAMLLFSCKAFASFGESENAKTQFQNNEKKRIARVLKQFSITGKIEVIYRLSTGAATTKPLAFDPQVKKPFEIGLKFTRAVAVQSDAFGAMEHASEDGESAQDEIDRLNEEKKTASEDKAIQDRAQTLALAMSASTQKSLDEANNELTVYRDELSELRNRLAVKETELFNANERILALTTDNAKLAKEVSELNASAKPIVRRKTRV